MFKINIRHSIPVLAAAAIVIGTAAFTLAHAHQSLEVKTLPMLSNNTVSNESDSLVSIRNSNNSYSSHDYSADTGSKHGKNLPNKTIKEPGEFYNPKTVPAQDKFPELKSKYGLLTIPTYDGSNQLTHPKVLYFANGWHGYKYWMSMTPYPYAQDDYENPSVVASNDGEKWVVPTGLKNPISGVPSDVKIGGHYSDPHLVMRGNVMELWYRYNPGNAYNNTPINSVNIYYKSDTTDGIHWSSPKVSFNAGRDGGLSMAVNYENGIYKAWYSTYSGKLHYITSDNSLQWSNPVTASIELPDTYQPYHQDVIKVGSHYCLLLSAIRRSDYTFAQFFANSSDGIHFSRAKRIFPLATSGLWRDVSFYRSSMVEKNGNIEMYLALWLPDQVYSNKTWYITRRTFLLQNLLQPEPNVSNAPSSAVPSSVPPKPPVTSAPSIPSPETSKPSDSSNPSSFQEPKASSSSSIPSAVS